MTGLLKVVAAVAVVIAALWYFTGNATGQQQLPEASPFITACGIATAVGTVDGVVVSSCRRVSEETLGNESHVTVSVRVAGQGRFHVSFVLLRSDWGLAGLSISPAP